MAMSKKDFEALAALVRESRKNGLFAGEPAADSFAEDLADTLSPSNERFDRERFLLACKPESHVKVVKV